MAYLDDKILRGGEITSQGEFNKVSAFYIMLVPKSTDAASVGILNVKLSQNDSLIDFPLSVGMWNPVVINKVNVKSSDLANYRIFWGAE